MYVSSLISISFVLSKIWPREESIMKNKWLRGDNLINIQGKIMDSALPLTAIYLYKPSFISILFVLFKIWPEQATIMKNSYGE